MAEPAGIQERVTRLEHEMAEVRYLATKAEREGSEFRAVISGQTGVLNALRETQLEQGRTLATHGRRLDSLDEKVDHLEEKVDNGFAEMRDGFAHVETKFAVLKAGQERITDLLTSHLGELDRGER